MKAVVCTDFNEWEIQEFPMPDPSPDEVVVEINHVQLSVTDCQRFRGADVKDLDSVKYQMEHGDGRILGHELSGEVVEAGDDVTGLEEGDRVYPPAKVPCGDCSYCESGYTELCVDLHSIGHERPGGLAEYVPIPASILRKLPKGITDAEGAAMQPLNSAMICMESIDVNTGDVIAVIGAGVMGFQCGQIARRKGAGEVYGIDIDPTKLDIISEHGLRPVNAREEDPVETIRERTNGIGADTVISAVGGEQSHMDRGDDPAAQAYRMVRKDGQILQVGHILGEATIRPKSYRKKMVDWINPRRGVYNIGPNAESGELVTELVDRGEINIDEYITHELDGLESFEEAVEITLNKPEYGALGPAQIVVN